MSYLKVSSKQIKEIEKNENAQQESTKYTKTKKNQYYIAKLSYSIRWTKKKKKKKKK